MRGGVREEDHYWSRNRKHSKRLAFAGLCRRRCHQCARTRASKHPMTCRIQNPKVSRGHVHSLRTSNFARFSVLLLVRYFFSEIVQCFAVVHYACTPETYDMIEMMSRFATFRRPQGCVAFCVAFGAQRSSFVRTRVRKHEHSVYVYVAVCARVCVRVRLRLGAHVRVCMYSYDMITVNTYTHTCAYNTSLYTYIYIYI